MINNSLSESSCFLEKLKVYVQLTKLELNH